MSWESQDANENAKECLRIYRLTGLGGADTNEPHRLRAEQTGGQDMETRALKSICSHLEWHLGELVKDGHIEHQAPQQVLQHGRADVPAGTCRGLVGSHLEARRTPSVGPCPPVQPHLQSAMRQSSMTSRCALVSERPRDRRYIV